MKSTINQSNIIILALIYNYISNGEKSLSVEKFTHFRNRLQYEVYYKAKQERFVFSYREAQQDIYRVDLRNNQLVFNSVLELDLSQQDYIKEIPESVIKASLNQKILSLIDVDLEKIKTEVGIVHKRETTKNYSTSQKSAVKREKEYHEELGHKNVVIESAHFVYIGSETGYEITTSWDEEYTRFVIEKPKTYSKGFLSLASKEFLNSIGDDPNE